MRNAAIDARIREEYRQTQPNYSLIRELEAQKHNQVTPLDVPKASDKAYEYKFRFRNTDARQIISLKWVYVFKDAATGQELLRHSFEGKVKVGPGREKELVSYTDSGPPMVVNAGAVKKSGRAWDESVTIEVVEYSDGSRWAKK
jgi:hypothetical protein